MSWRAYGWQGSGVERLNPFVLREPYTTATWIDALIVRPWRRLDFLVDGVPNRMWAMAEAFDEPDRPLRRGDVMWSPWREHVLPTEGGCPHLAGEAPCNNDECSPGVRCVHCGARNSATWPACQSCQRGRKPVTLAELRERETARRRAA